MAGLLVLSAGSSSIKFSPFSASHRPESGDVALPSRPTEEGILRYGAHGLSYEYIASVLPDVAGAAVAGGRVIVAHLGAGARETPERPFAEMDI